MRFSRENVQRFRDRFEQANVMNRHEWVAELLDETDALVDLLEALMAHSYTVHYDGRTEIITYYDRKGALREVAREET